MTEGTESATVLLVGAVGVGGTLAGVFLTDLLAKRREKRAAVARQQRAIRAVIGELLDAISILDTAIKRQAWWPPLDAPRDRSWEQYSDDLAEALDDEKWNQIRMTYETHRSLNALRDVPKSETKPGSSPAEQALWHPRWPDAASSAEDSFEATRKALQMLRSLTVSR